MRTSILSRMTLRTRVWIISNTLCSLPRPRCSSALGKSSRTMRLLNRLLLTNRSLKMTSEEAWLKPSIRFWSLCESISEATAMPRACLNAWPVTSARMPANQNRPDPSSATPTSSTTPLQLRLCLAR
eukprot:Lithocolla_globosa_v1_NODE_1772_length_2347_cov_13.723822.p2 type:complete len:127 gc:universal NODE_1772_length_2347_cov_13.723822:1416-1036(-)